jgi:hypothetical protein
MGPRRPLPFTYSLNNSRTTSRRYSCGERVLGIHDVPFAYCLQCQPNYVFLFHIEAYCSYGIARGQIGCDRLQIGYVGWKF